MTDYKTRFQTVLRELFQFDAADLDFGIYRILNYKRDQINRFVEEDIAKTVDQAFAKYRDERMENIGWLWKFNKWDVDEWVKSGGANTTLPSQETSEAEKRES